jgi:hypothetical protein
MSCSGTIVDALAPRAVASREPKRLRNRLAAVDWQDRQVA